MDQKKPVPSTHREDLTRENLGGLVFFCDSKIKAESLQNNIFGLPKNKLNVVEKLTAGKYVYLLDTSTKLLYGSFISTTNGAKCISPSSFTFGTKSSRYPCQVGVERIRTCTPLRPKEYGRVLQEVRPGSNLFYLDLYVQEVEQLNHLFQDV